MFPYRKAHKVTISPEVPAVSVSDLTFTYEGASRPACYQINLEVFPGKKAALVGHNGSGKSTLLKIISGDIDNYDGKVKLWAHACVSCLQKVAYVPQVEKIEWTFPINVERFVLTGCYIHLGWFSRVSKKHRQLAQEVMTRLHIADLGGRQISELSGGQQQRVLLARAFMQEADLLVFDEPLTALDKESKELIMSELNKACEEGKTLIMATHERAFGAEFFDHIFRLDHGELVEVKHA